MVAASESDDAVRPGGRTRFRDRLLAEAVRAYESASVEPVDDGEATDAARNLPERAGFEQRIVVRASRLAIAGDLGDALRRVRSTLAWAVATGALAAFVAGGLAASAALSEHSASVFGLIVGLLGVQTLMLVLWLLVTAIGPRLLPGGALGRVVVNAGRRLAERMRRGRAQSAAGQAYGGVAMASPWGRWTVAAITHALWVAANLGMLTVMAVLFLGERYQFRWDSTWLSDEGYTRLVSTLAELPDAVGFSTPSEEEIIASRRPPQTTERDARGSDVAWSWFFYGSVVVYGLAPRLVLLVASLLLRWRAAARYRLDLSRPGFARLRRRLVPDAASLRPPAHDADATTEAPAQPGVVPEDARPAGPPVVLGFELQPPRSGWPPPLEPRVDDLGMVDGRDDQHHVIDALSQRDTSPSRTLVVCDYESSPDRGVERFLSQVRRAAGGRVILILTGGHRLADRAAPTLDQRAEDWRAMAGRAGLPEDCLVDLDLDHLTDTTKSRLNALVSADARSSAEAPNRRIEHAFRVIAERAEHWSDAVATKQEVELHRAVAEVYEHEDGGAGRWRQWFGGDAIGEIDWRSPDAVAPVLQRSAKRIQALLPPSMRNRPQWAAAGALCGAVGCIAAASLISPVAIAALPGWSGVGAAIGALMPSWRSRESKEPQAGGDGFPSADAVRSAALFAMLLELQGRDEPVIHRVLDRVTTSLEEDNVVTPDENIRAWLDALRHRFDLALAEEARP